MSDYWFLCKSSEISITTYPAKKTLGGMFKTSNVRAGLFLKSPGGERYVLAQVAPSMIAAIALYRFNANRKNEAIRVADVTDFTPFELSRILGADWADYVVHDPIESIASGQAGKRLGDFFSPTADIGVGTFLRSPMGTKYLLTADGGNVVCTNMTKAEAGKYYGVRKVKSHKQLDRDEVSGLLGGDWEKWEVISADQVLAA